jgi:hypothetical protein
LDIARFVMSIAMHVAIYDGARVGLEMMKFPLNHPQRFNNATSCFCLGYFKFNIVIQLEICNIFYMLYVTTTAQVVYSYIKLLAIVSIDTLLYNSMVGDPFYNVTKKPLKD